MQTSAPWRESRRTLSVSGLAIPAALTVPATEPLSGLVVLVPGSLFSDVDGNFPTWNIFPRTNAFLAEQLAARGHAVYRFAKVGPGTGTEIVDDEAYQRVRCFAGRQVIALAALDDARAGLRDAGLAAGRTVLAGHSEGAVVVACMAPRADSVDGVVLLSGPSVGLLGIMREQAAASLEPEGRHDELALVNEAYERVRRGENVPEDWAERSELIRMLLFQGQAALKWIRQIDEVDPAAAAKEIEQPVLIVQGGRDGSVQPHHAERLAAVRSGKPTDSAFFPELQHMYKPMPEGLDGQAAFALDGPTDPRVSQAIDAWIRKL